MDVDRGAGRAAAPSSRSTRPPMEISVCESGIDDAGGRWTDSGSAADEGTGGNRGRHRDVLPPHLPSNIDRPDTRSTPVAARADDERIIRIEKTGVGAASEPSPTGRCPGRFPSHVEGIDMASDGGRTTRGRAAENAVMPGAAPASSSVSRSPERIHPEFGRSPPGAAGPDTTPAAR
jgi:hypothetical protein